MLDDPNLTEADVMTREVIRVIPHTSLGWASGWTKQSMSEGAACISIPESSIEIRIVATDEAMIARHTQKVVSHVAAE